MTVDLLRPALALVAAAALVLVGVVGVAALVLPEAPVRSGEAAAGPASSTIPPGTSASGAPTIPREPPSLPGGTVQMRGDRESSVTFDPTHSGTREDSRYFLDGDGDSLILVPDPGEGLHVDQATMDGLNFFLDPGDCSLTEAGLSEETGLASFDLSCPDISDVQGNNTVSLEGHVAVPILMAFPERYPTGGTVSVTGDLEAEIETNSAFWYIFHEQDFQSHEITGSTNTFNSFTYDDSGAVRGLAFDVTEDGDVLLQAVHPDYETVVEVETCPAMVERLARVSPDTEYLEVTIDCPEMTGTVRNDPDEATVDISVRGSLRVLRQEQMQSFFSN